MTEKDWDIKSWPALHPDGKYGLHHKRRKKLSDQQYLGQRILNSDLRFSKSPGFIFAAAAYIEQKQLTSKANISFMRGRKTVSKEGMQQYELDDAFTTFEGVKHTPKYWQKVKYDMIAKLENLGPFHLFFTLSCGDTRCEEKFSSVLHENGYNIEYSVKEDGTTETKVNSEDGRIRGKLLAKFLQEDIDDSLHEMIRTNVLTATRTFQHRVDAFRKDIKIGQNNPMMIENISYRVECQDRGAAHIHGTLWLDIVGIENSSIFKDAKTEEQTNHLSEAFRKFRDDEKLTEEEKKAIALLTDTFITCSLNPDSVHKKIKIGQRVIAIAKEVNCHHCTKKCDINCEKCKYGFPRYPLKETLVVDKNEFSGNPNPEIEHGESSSTKSPNYNKILFDVEEVLRDKDKIQEIEKKNPKGIKKEAYIKSRLP